MFTFYSISFNLLVQIHQTSLEHTKSNPAYYVGQIVCKLECSREETAPSRPSIDLLRSW